MPPTGKKILLHAYVNLNIGDDLFLRGICRRYPDSQFYVYAPRRIVKYYRQFEPNLTLIPYGEAAVLWQKIDGKFFNGYFLSRLHYRELSLLDKKWVSCTDGQIWLGGSQFVETKDWKTILKYKRRQQNSSNPFFAVSVTFGPYQSKAYHREAAAVVSRYTDICFRDKTSFLLTGRPANGRFEADMVFAVPLPPAEHWGSGAGSDRNKTVCISLIDVKKRFGRQTGEQYENFIAEAVRYYQHQHARVYLLSLCDNHKDWKCAERIMKKLPDTSGVFIIHYDGCLDRMLQLIRQADLLIATRYHAIVLGLRFGKPVLPIIYESKTRYLLRDLGKKGVTVQQLGRIPVDAMEQYYICLSKKQIEQLAASAERQYSAIDSFMYSGWPKTDKD